MHKLLLFFLVCFAIGLTLARQDKVQSHFKKKDPFPHFTHDLSRGNRKLSKFCSNNTIAQAYLTQILSVIDNLQANSSYNSILKLKSDNFITYLNDTNHQELLRSNCEAFIKGLNEAIKADKLAQRVQKRLAETIQKQIKQVARNVTNGKGFYEF